MNLTYTSATEQMIGKLKRDIVKTTMSAPNQPVGSNDYQV